MADVTLQYKKDGTAADCRVFLYSYTSIGSMAQVDNGTWTTGADGELVMTGLTSGAAYIVVCVDPDGVKNTQVRKFTA